MVSISIFDITKIIDTIHISDVQKMGNHVQLKVFYTQTCVFLI